MVCMICGKLFESQQLAPTLKNSHTIFGTVVLSSYILNYQDLIVY